MPHQKHVALARPEYGEFHRSEWAFIGAPCGRIQELTAKLIAYLAPHYQLGYVDADHAAADQAESMSVAQSPLVYTDKINFQRFDYATPHNAFHRRPMFAMADGVLVNGNHFCAKQQIVILDPKKKESLSRKLDRLTDVALLLTTDNQSQTYDFLQDHLGDNTPVIMPLGDLNGIAQWLRAQLTSQRASVQGLVLAGGKSERMGVDKSLLEYHGMPQREYALQLLAQQNIPAHLSLREADASTLDIPVVADTFIGLGPMGAILSAFRTAPEAAWLTMACDMPLVDDATLQLLLQKRNHRKLATAFHNPATGWPDPLLTIWEPRAYPVLLQFLAQGYSCPRKVLINSDIELVALPDPKVLLNVNKPEEREAVLAQMQNK